MQALRRRLFQQPISQASGTRNNVGGCFLERWSSLNLLFLTNFEGKKMCTNFAVFYHMNAQETTTTVS